MKHERVHFEQISVLKVLQQPDGWRKHDVVTLFSTETISHSETTAQSSYSCMKTTYVGQPQSNQVQREKRGGGRE